MHKAKSTLASLIIVFFSIAVTGCWDATEIDQLAIVTTTGIDIVNPDSRQPMYNVTLQIARTSQLGSSQGGGSSSSTGERNTFVTMAQKGPDPMMGIQRLRTETARKIIMSHRRAVILGEPYAKFGIASTIDQMVRNPNLRMNAYLLVAYHNNASTIVTLPYALNRLPSEALDNLRKEGYVNRATTKNFLSELTGKGDPWLPGIEPVKTKSKNEPNTFNLVHIAVFHKDKLMGWLNGLDAIGFYWLINNVRTDILNVEIPRHIGRIDCQIIHSNTVRRVRVVNGKPNVHMRINVTAEIVTNGTDLNLTEVDNIQLVEKIMAAKIKDIASSSIQKIQHKYRADIIDFGDTVYRTHPRLWHRLESNWSEEFTHVPVDIQVNVKVLNAGTIGAPSTNIERW